LEVKFFSIKFYENPSSCSWVVAGVTTNGQTDSANSVSSPRCSERT
jgi:hypothetical protein